MTHDPIARARAAVMARPADPNARVALGAVLPAGSERQTALAEAADLVLNAIAAGALDDATLAADALFALTGAVSDGRLVAYARATRGEIPAAREILARLLTQDPQDVETRLQVATFALADDDPDAALAVVRPLEGSSAEADATLVSAHLAAGDHRAAIAVAQAAATRSAQDTTLLTLLGLGFMMSGDPRAAVAPFRGALAADPTRPEVHYNLAAALADAGDLAAALGVADTGLALAPSDPRLHGLRVQVRNRLAAETTTQG